MNGIFSKWQPRYADQGIPTFPVSADKKPSISNWQRVGLKASARLAAKFSNADAIGLPLGRRTGITILDLDAKDLSLLHDAQARYGQSSFVAETGGGYHAYYRHSGEGRHIRPFGSALPIDVLGGGFAVAPPSIAAKGQYEIIQGSIEDLKSLPPLHAVLDGLRLTSIPDGVRNKTVFRRLLREVRHCDDFDSLLDVARTLNMDCIPPMSDASVLSTAKQVWRYEITGNNWVGRRARASTDREEILAFSRDPYAAHLLNLLRVSHPMPDDRFAIDQIKTAKLLGWDRGTVGVRIRTLINANHLERVHSGRGKGDPHLYRLKRS